MSEGLPVINETVEVLFDEAEGLVSTSRIKDFTQGVIQMFWPMRGGVRVAIERDKRITLVYHRDTGIFSCPGVVAEVVKGSTPVVHLRPVGAVNRVQRREYVRVKTSVPLLMQETAPAKNPSKPFESRTLSLAARTIDLSGGGISIFKELSVPVGATFNIKLTLEEDEPALDLAARIVSVTRTQDIHGRQLYRMGIQFLGVPETKQKMIMRKVFKIQRETAARTVEIARPQAPRPKPGLKHHR
jgi:c-di-GMP-binding flagellar brake protein YcgR